MSKNVKNLKINVITLGASGVGKTSIIKRIKDNTFSDFTLTTLSFDNFFIKKNYEKKNLEFTLIFHDTMGQEQYQNIIPIQYIRDSAIVLLIFCNINTLDDIKRRWIKYYKENSNIDNARFILVGNKSDIFGEERDEIVKQGEDFAEEINAHFMTCSAKSADNMDNLERYIVTEAKRYSDENEDLLNNNNNDSKNTKNKKLDNDKTNKKHKRDCCK